MTCHRASQEDRDRRRTMTMMRSGCVAALVLSLCFGAAPVSAAPVIDAGAAECTSNLAPEVTPPLAVETEPILPLEVRVMVEAGDLAAAKEHLAVTRGAFERIGIKLKVRYDVVVPPGTWGTGFFNEPSGDEIFAFMKDHYGGARPAGVDLVYFMTRHWSGGMADCVGGVRSPESAFAFGSMDYKIAGLTEVPTADEGVIAAHELGHLLGAHHHYSNCTEALPSGALRGDFNPCTTMSPAAATASSTFGLLERSFVRYYVEQYAKG